MAELYYLMHYVVYKFYRRHLESQWNSMMYAISIHTALFSVFLTQVLLILGDHYDFLIPDNVNELFLLIFAPIVLALLFGYLLFFRDNRYIDIFSEFDELAGIPEMKRKIVTAKVVNLTILLIDVAILFYVDYRNHH